MIKPYYFLGTVFKASIISKILKYIVTTNLINDNTSIIGITTNPSMVHIVDVNQYKFPDQLALALFVQALDRRTHGYLQLGESEIFLHH